MTHHQSSSVTTRLQFGSRTPLNRNSFIIHLGAHSSIVMFKGNPKSNTTKMGDGATVDYRDKGPQLCCLALGFSLHKLKAYINNTSTIDMLKALRIWNVSLFSKTSSCIINVNM